MFSLKRWMTLWIICSAYFALGQEMQEGRLMRFPDIYKDKIAFMYGGDLWLASSNGGVARQITSHAGGASSFLSFHPTANGSPSPLSTTAISMSTLFLPMADSPNNSRSTRAAQLR